MSTVSHSKFALLCAGALLCAAPVARAQKAPVAPAVAPIDVAASKPAPQAALTPQECGVDVRPQDLADGDYGGFYTWPELVKEMDGWLQKYPNLISVSRLGTTVEGRAIPLLRISNHPASVSADKPQILYLVGLHPREQAPTVAIVRFVNELLSRYGTDAEITKLVDSREIWVVPMLNVDGKIYDFQHGNGTTRGGDWRKNRRANPDGTYGIDLNRNFPVRWGGNRAIDPTWKASTQDKSANIYEGPAPASEPETRAAMNFISSHPLRVMLDLHSPLHDMRTPGFLSRSEAGVYQGLMDAMQKSQKTPYPMQVGKADAEPATAVRGGDSGISYPWSYYTTGAYSFNIEMGFQSAPDAAYSIGLKARYADAASVETEYADNIRGPLFALLREAGNLQLAKKGSAVLRGSKWQGEAKPGALVVWQPQIEGAYDYAVAFSGSSAGVIPLEFRLHPDQSGFPIQIQPEAQSGTRIPLSLYVWKNRERSVFQTEIVVK